MSLFKQALAMMREEKLFSAIHIAGTAMAIAFTMVMAVVYYIKQAPIYPEVNRLRTVYFNMIEVRVEKNGKAMGVTGYCFSEKAFEQWFLPSKNYEYCAPTLAMTGSGKISSYDKECAVKEKDEYIASGRYGCFPLLDCVFVQMWCKKYGFGQNLVHFCPNVV